MVRKKCSPTLSEQNSKNKNWRGTQLVVSRPFLSGERITKAVRSILDCRCTFRRASKRKSTTASDCRLLLGSFSSPRKMLRLSSTRLSTRAAGLQHSLKSHSGKRRGRNRRQERKRRQP